MPESILLCNGAADAIDATKAVSQNAYSWKDYQVVMLLMLAVSVPVFIAATRIKETAYRNLTHH